MANVTVYNMEGNEVGTMELNDAVFGVEVNEHLVHLAVVRQLANNRQGTQKAKTRSLTLADVKTKEMQKVLTNLKAEKALVITATDDKNVIISARNIADVQTATPSTINVYDVMNHGTVVVTKDAVASIEEVYA